MDSDDETILSKMDEHRIGEIDSMDLSGVSTDVPLLDTSVKQEVESDDEFRSGLRDIFTLFFTKFLTKIVQTKFSIVNF